MANYTFDLPDRVVNACALDAGWKAGDPDTQLQAGIKAILAMINKKTDNHYIGSDLDVERGTSTTTQEGSADRASEV